jgi:gas vesicle protein
MAYLKGFGHGLAAGVVVGMLVAPRPGRETRSDLVRKYRRARATIEQVAETTQRGWQTARPAAQAAGRAAASISKAMGPAARTARDRLGELAGRNDGALAGRPSPFFAPVPESAEGPN